MSARDILQAAAGVGGGGSTLDVISIGVNDTSVKNLYLYEWNESSGVGAQLDTSAISTTYNIEFHAIHDNSLVYTTYTSGNRIYACSLDASGISSVIGSPASYINYAKNVDFSPDGSVVLVSGYFTPFVAAYPFDAVTGFGARYSDPATFSIGNVYSSRLSPDGSVYLLAGTAADYVSAYPWDNTTGFGAKYASPSVLPSFAQAVTITSTNDAVVTAGSGGSKITAWAFDPATGFGAKYANPTTLPGINLTAVLFNHDNTLVFVKANGSTSTALIGYEWSSASGFGAQLASPPTIAGYYATYGDMDISPDGTAIGLATIPASGPVVSVVGIGPSGYTSTYTSPSIGTSTTAYSVKFGRIAI